MATLRVTRELVEYALDLPEALTVTGCLGMRTLPDGTVVIEFTVDGTHEDIVPDPDGTYALGYGEVAGMALALNQVVPVEQSA